jgi:methyl-accepting chemotaxis protein
MHAIFAPAIALMNHLRYPKKFAVLGVVALIAIVILQALLYRELSGVIAPTREEIAGLQSLKPMNRMVQAMQQHRGLSSGVLNGNESLKPQRAEKEKAVDAELAATVALMPAAIAKSERWQAIEADWAKLRGEGLSMAPADNLKLHSGMIAKALIAMTDVADQTSLTLDPDIDSYYMMDSIVLKMPIVLEPLGVLRARGTGALARKELNEDQKLALGILLDRIGSTQSQQKQSLEKVMTYAPGTKAILGEAPQRFEENVAALVKLVRSDILAGNFQTDSAEYFKQATAVIDQGYTVMFKTLIPTMEALLTERLNSHTRALQLTLTLTIGVALLFAWLAMGAYLSMSLGVSALGAGAERLAGGDLTGRVECPSHDELADVAEHFNHMAQSMHGLLRKVRTTADELGRAAGVVSASAATVADSSEQQSDAASSMAASIEQLTVGINEISDHTAGAQQVSGEAMELSAEGGRTVEQTVSEMQKIADSVNRSAAVIGKLGEQSDRISAIVATIKEIADQTNLLALNAAIEAARAGEQGRGFAVVADEVRKLAERTTQSTQEISSMIGAIQTGTSEAVRTMQEGVQRVGEGVVLSQRAGESISRMRQGTLKVQENVSEIANGLKEEAAASDEIAKNVERIAQMIEQNSHAVGDTAKATRDLERLATELQAEVSRFKV